MTTEIPCTRTAELEATIAQVAANIAGNAAIPETDYYACSACEHQWGHG